MLDAYRKSTVISSQQAEAIVWAVLLAYSRNLHLNAWLTINLDKIHIPRGQARVFLTQFKKMMGDWLRKRSGLPLSYVGVFENPGQVHLHVHFLLHVPTDLICDFRKNQRGWLKRCGATHEAGEPHLRFLCRCNPSAACDCLESIGKKVSYMLKGADPEFCTAQDIDHVPQGEILGKRLSISQTLRTSGAPELAPNELHRLFRERSCREVAVALLDGQQRSSRQHTRSRRRRGTSTSQPQNRNGDVR